MKVSQFTEQQRSVSMPPTRRLFVILANNRGPDISIVDVPSHHCALPQPKTENDYIIRRHLRTRSARGRGIAQAHTKIKIRKFLLRGLWPFIRNFAPTKISLYTVYVIVISRLGGMYPVYSHEREGAKRPCASDCKPDTSRLGVI